MSNNEDYIINLKENLNSINLEIKKPDLRYLNEFVRLKCSADLLALKVFPNAKEITESFAAYNAVRKYLQSEFPLDDSHVTCFVVGDGCTPRTGATFAFRTNWTVISIDPQLYKTKHSRGDWFPISGVDRLLGFRGAVEDVDEAIVNCSDDKILIVNVHSHASIKSCLSKLGNTAETRTVISIPCCVPDNIIFPETSYIDYGIHSPKRRVNIYKKDLIDIQQMGLLEKI